MSKIISVAAVFLMVCSTAVNGQVSVSPGYGLKSHETLEIDKIETSPGKTVISLAIENRIVNGSFCADRNIYLFYPDGSKSKLLSSEGIPVCPDSHKFGAPGEKLSFRLTFPAIKEGTGWIDLVEDCSENCFSFYGITLDPDLNVRLEETFALAAKQGPEQNAGMFIRLLDEIDSLNSGIEGLIYINIINSYIEAGDKVNSIVFYKRLVSSGAPRKESYLKYLNNKGIKF